MLRKNYLVAAAVGIISIGACASAYAGPTETVDGVTFPVGEIPGGNSLVSGILDETTISGPNQQFQGVGVVNSINDSIGTQVWGNGNNNTELAFVFSDYTSTAATSYPNFYFTGGMITFYTLPAGTQINGLGSTAQDIAAVEAGTVWLTEVGAPFDPAGDTLTAAITTGSSLTAFNAASGFGVLDVTGGPAAAFYATCTFTNAFDTNGCSDETFTSDFSSGAAGDFDVSGSGTIKANAVPEPFSLSLLGVGLVAIGVTRRRWVSKSV